MAVETRSTTNEDICRALGIDPDDVLEVDIRLRPMERPLVVVTRSLGYDKGADDLVKTVAYYELVESPDRDPSKEQTP